jgi:hypothetical protein
VEVMKSNVESRVNAFKQNLDKFAARWHQLKPKDIDMEGDTEACINAVKSIKERRAEFNELEESKGKLMYVINSYFLQYIHVPVVLFCLCIFQLLTQSTHQNINLELLCKHLFGYFHRYLF